MAVSLSTEYFVACWCLGEDIYVIDILTIRGWLWEDMKF